MLRDQPGLIPADVTWTTFYDQAIFVSDSVHGTRDAIVIGVLLAAVVLLVFLRDLRLTIAAVLAVPVTVALAGLGLSLTHQTIDMMTLAGIAAALGLIADDAIVVVENIERHRATGEGGDDTAMVATDQTVIAIYPGFQALDLTGPHEVFAAARTPRMRRPSPSSRRERAARQILATKAHHGGSK